MRLISDLLWRRPSVPPIKDYAKRAAELAGRVNTLVDQLEEELQRVNHG